MSKLKLLVYFLMSLVLCFGVLANYEYLQVGSSGYDFVLGTGIFNSGLADYDSYVRSITRDSGVPLVADLDGDGVNEIVVYDSGVFRLYHYKTLAIVDSFNSGLGSNPYFIAYDIDDDSLLEILAVSRSSNVVRILEYNGSVFRNQTADLGLDIGTNGIKWLGCRPFECVVVGGSDRQIDAGIPTEFKITAFNSSAVLDTLSVHGSMANRIFCPSQVPVVSVADYDNDGVDEFIFGYAWYIAADVDSVKVQYVDINESDQVDIELTVSKNFGFDVAGGGDDCNNIAPSGIAATRYFNSPLVFDVDGSSSNGLETVFAMMQDQDEFKMFSFNSDGSSLDDYPEVLEADGVIVSNMMKFNSFTDTGLVDFCVLGFEPADRLLDLVCASEQTGDIPETDEFFFDLGLFYNLSVVYGDYEILSHAVQMSSATTEGNNLNELLCGYGVFSLDYTAINKLDLIFENPKSNGVVVSCDAEKVDLEDLLVMTATNLWYLDDGFTNSPATISQYYVDPCIDNVWKQNTSVEVRITADDPEGGLVNVSAVLYAGTSFNQSAAWQTVASGTTVPLFFVANRTIGSGVLRLMAKDLDNPSVVDVVDLTVSVSTVGISWGDGCVTDVDLTAEPTNVSRAPSDLSEDEKADIREAILPSTLVPINYQPIIAILVVIVVTVAVALVMAEKGVKDGMAVMYIPLGCGLASWLFFVFIGMIAGWTVIVAIVFGAAVIGFKVYNGRPAGLG